MSAMDHRRCKHAAAQFDGGPSRANVVVVAGISFWMTGCPEPEPEPPDLDPSLLGCGWAADETGGESDAGFEALAESPEFREYVDEHVVAYPGGQWLIEGDILVHDYELVLEGYRRFRQAQGDGEPDSDVGFRATVACDTDWQIDQIWNPSDKLNLSYCLDRSWDEVPALRLQAIQALDRATMAWESAADINFVATASGAACSHATARFVVSYHGTECLYIFGIPVCSIQGLAFFPNAPEEERALGLWLKAFQQGPAVLERIVAHELGHILGLWHEHARFPQAAGICAASSIEGGAARGVTEADSDSVMGYPQCWGTNPLPPHPSALDRTSVEFLYNLPRPILAGALAPDNASTLAWHRPSQGEFVVWEPYLSSGQNLEFDETTGCYSQDCSAGAAPWWKPVLYRNDESVDVLMYGPGGFDEVRFTGLDGVLASSDPGSLVSSVDVPVVLDRFFGNSDRSVWWIRPSYPNDLLWRDLGGIVTATDAFNEKVFTDEHFGAALGKLAFGQNAALWVSPTSTLAYLTYASNGQLQQVAIDKGQCGLENGVHYNAVPGDFDGDSLDELAWYDFDSEVVTVWPSVTSCIGAPQFSVGKAKLAAIRLAGQRDSLMAYRPQDGTVDFYDAMTGVRSESQKVGVDASPVLRDFDSDGCTDILWFSPHLSSSPVWHSRCDGTFVVTSVEHPESVYPLGFGLGHGRP